MVEPASASAGVGAGADDMVVLAYDSRHLHEEVLQPKWTTFTAEDTDLKLIMSKLSWNQVWAPLPSGWAMEENRFKGLEGDILWELTDLCYITKRREPILLWDRDTGALALANARLASRALIESI